MKKETIKDYATLLLSEICEVTGCTEPASIAFATAKAMKVLKDAGCYVSEKNVSVRLMLSREVYRNASTVKVPILRQKGIKPAVIGGLYGNAFTFNPFASLKKRKIREMLGLMKKENWLTVIPLEREGLYVEVEIEAEKNISRVIIGEKHDRIKRMYLNKRIIFQEKYDEKTILKIEDLSQIRDITRKRIPELENIAMTFLNKQSRLIKNKSSFEVITETERLISNRMEGCNFPVQTITGSGNQGLFISVPFYKLYLKYDEKVLPSFLFTLLTQIYLTQQRGRISSLCGLSDKSCSALVAG
ncbi:MAG: L-serine ammonia-lyase, iron-sulfur-dependent, subunit alpha, partial [Elusimicrobiota bacterium]